MIDLTSKLGEINDIEHNKGSKNISSKSSFFRLFMSSIPLKHCFSYYKKTKKKVKKHFFFFFTFLNWEKQTWYWKKVGYFRLGMGLKFGP